MTEITAVATPTNRILSVVKMLLAFAFFMWSIDLLTLSMGNLNSSFAKDLFRATNNPFVGLFIGILMTALVQSSSTVTAMFVAVVASGNLSLLQAVPLVMGANIGTTLTSTLVAFSYLMKKEQFKKALAAGVLHDVFNILTVLILFPLEVYFGFLSNMASFLTHALFEVNQDFDGDYHYNVFFTRPISERLFTLLGPPWLALLFSVIVLFSAIKVLSDTVLNSFFSKGSGGISKNIFMQPFLTFLYGIFFTAAIQSSTVTTSLVVPAVAGRKVSLNRDFPFIIGANIGTTITAGIAAFYKTEAAISLALVHFLFNGLGALIFLPFPGIRSIPVKIATFLGGEATRTRLVGIAYILLTFFIIPFFLIYFNQEEDISKSDLRRQKTEWIKKEKAE